MLKNDPVTKLVSSAPNVDVKETSMPLQRYLHLRPHQFDFSPVVPDPLDSSWRPMQIQSISYGGTGVKISLVVQKTSRFFDKLENHKQDFSKQYEGWVVRITMSPSMFRQLDLNTQQVVYIKPHDDSDYSTNSNKYEI